MDSAALAPAPERVGVLLVNLGTPDSGDTKGVRIYLREFLSDPRVIENQGIFWKLALNGVILTKNTDIPVGAVIGFTSSDAVSSYLGAASAEYAVAPYYFGGRVEAFSPGRVEGPYNAYDINSAYPRAMMDAAAG